MKLINTVAVAFVLVLFCTVALAEGKIDPLLHIMAANQKTAPTQMKAFGAKAVSGRVMADVILKAEEGESEAAAAFIKELGGEVRTVIGDIMTATIPIDSLEDLEFSELISAVEAAKPIVSKAEDPVDVDIDKMNHARLPTTGSGVETVQTEYTGTGVIVGIVDSGIDCLHADFKDGSGNTRIIAYYDQATSTDYTTAQLQSGACSSTPDTSGHGTHVAGIAAGSNTTYKGVASTADIIAVKYNTTDASSSGTFSTSILEGANYIFTKATALGKAAVVNLSLGTSLGAHDGTSLLEQGLDTLLISGGYERKGRAIVNAAGNENYSTNDAGKDTYGGIHATISVTSGTDKGYEVYTMDATNASTIIDFWLDSASTCTAKVIGYNATGGTEVLNTGFVSYGSTKTETYGTVSVALSYTETATSGKKHGTATISTTSSPLNSYYFHFVLSGTCTGDAWLYPDFTSVNDFTKVNQIVKSGYTYVAGDSNRTITIPGTARCVITTASYMDYPSWLSTNGTTYYQTATDGTCGATGGTDQGISLFSSLGPTTSTVYSQKPEITAPGEPIMSTLSSSVSPGACYMGDATHYKLEGTSMASPHVAGFVALMMQKNKCMSVSQAKGYMTSSTGTTTVDYTWGYGKLNAVTSMTKFDADTSCTPGDASTITTCYTAPTPTPSSSSGCGGSLIDDHSTKNFAMGVVILFGALVLIPVIVLRRRVTR